MIRKSIPMVVCDDKNAVSMQGNHCHSFYLYNDQVETTFVGVKKISVET